MGRFYKIDSKRSYPSVTTILDATLPEPEGLKRWKKRTKNWEQIRDYKAKNGTIIHYRILNKLSPSRLELPDFPQSEFPDGATDYADISTSMFSELSIEFGFPRYVEHTVYSHTYKFAGTLDLAAPAKLKNDDDFIFTVFDLKTSSGVRERYFYQVAAYWLALTEMTGNRAKRGAIIVIHPYIEKNRTLKPTVEPIYEKDLHHYSLEFIKLVEKFYETAGDHQ